MTSDAAIADERADREDLELPTQSFDLIYSSLAFHIVGLDALMAEIRRALVSGGRLVFSVEHPIYPAPGKPGWGARDLADRAASGSRRFRPSRTSVRVRPSCSSPQRADRRGCRPRPVVVGCPR
jgi:SAM-dependent methyltransferase